MIDKIIAKPYIKTMRLLITLFALMLSLLTPAHAQREACAPRILMLGDSLTAGYGLAQGQDVPSQLQNVLSQKSIRVRISNAGVSGDTAAGGLARLEWALSEGYEGAIIALGANDMLRGLDLKETEKALRAILEALRAKNIPALLIGMKAAPNLGKAYAESFEALYQNLARDYKIPLYPFMLEGVAGQSALNLPDGIHPNAQGVSIIAERMLPTLEAFIKNLKGRCSP